MQHALRLQMTQNSVHYWILPQLGKSGDLLREQIGRKYKIPWRVEHPACWCVNVAVSLSEISKDAWGLGQQTDGCEGPRGACASPGPGFI